MFASKCNVQDGNKHVHITFDDQSIKILTDFSNFCSVNQNGIPTYTGFYVHSLYLSVKGLLPIDIHCFLYHLQ